MKTVLVVLVSIVLALLLIGAGVFVGVVWARDRAAAWRCRIRHDGRVAGGAAWEMPGMLAGPDRGPSAALATWRQARVRSLRWTAQGSRRALRAGAGLYRP